MSSTALPQKHRSQRGARIASLTATYVILSILALIWIVPIVYIILAAFSATRNASNEIVGTAQAVQNFFPSAFGIQNFADLFTLTFNGVEYAFLRWMGNTLLVSVVCCLISTFLVLSVAYCMSKLRFTLRKPFMKFTMIMGLFPGFMSMIAIYFLLKSIGLSGNTEHPELSILGLIISYSAGAGLGFQVAKGFFDVLPNSLVESAKLDGCSNFKIFLKIILPLSKPIIIYTMLMAFTGPWMDFIFAKVIIGSTNTAYWTVSVGLYSLLYGEYGRPELFTQFAAGCVMVGIPITLLFMFLQRYYVEGVTAGAVKG